MTPDDARSSRDADDVPATLVTSASPAVTSEPAVAPAAAAPAALPAPLLELRDGLPLLTETPPFLAEACTALAAATGPVAIDAERASGYRYSSRAYLIQLRRDGAGTFLVDPIGFDSLAPLQEALAGTEWILHAATQDLACLAEVGLTPATLFDTELAGRLLGYPRVGLATLVETLLGYRMKKEHSAADWSTRPLPEPWLEYAALDVEVLVELRDGARRRARGDRQGRVGAAGVRGAQELRPRDPHRAVASYLGAPPGARPAADGRGPRAVVGPRRDRPRARPVPRPDHRRRRARGRRHRDADDAVAS